MKNVIFAILMLAPVCAIAAEKCVTLDPSDGKKCSSNVTDYDYKADWEATCPSSNGIPVRGIGVCAKTPGTASDSEVTVRDTLEVSSTNTENENCWCKMVSPAVSRWVFQGDPGSVSTCAMVCARNCAAFSQCSGAQCPLFRRALFSNLKD